MPRCLKCNGSGYVSKCKNCQHGTYDAYINGCNDTVRCWSCHGFGTTGIEFVKAALLEIRLSSKDGNAVKLAMQALREWNNI